jgi:OOP family OmpA-OmpF porin
MLTKLAFSLALGSCAVSASAQIFTNIEANRSAGAYVQDDRNVVVRSPYGLCWRTGYWTPADSITGCDGELAPPISKVIAPAFASPTTTSPAPAVTSSCNFNLVLEHQQTFEFNQAVLSDAAKIRIDTEVIGKFTACARSDVIVITGHTDRIGSSYANKKLSKKRAEVIADYLKSKGVQIPIKITAAGEEQPIKSCTEKLKLNALIDCLAPNRRVVIETMAISK